MHTFLLSMKLLGQAINFISISKQHIRCAKMTFPISDVTLKVKDVRIIDLHELFTKIKQNCFFGIAS